MAKVTKKAKIGNPKLANEILLKHHLIIKYRQLISRRYQYQNIKECSRASAY